MTNEWHHLVWTNFTPLPQFENAYTFHHGPIYWLALGYSYLCGTIIIIRLIKLLLNYHDLYRLQSLALLFFGAFPYIFGLLYSFGFNPFPELDLMPLGFSIGMLGISASIMFLHLFDLVPIGRNLLVESIQDGLIMVNQAGKVVDINPAAQRLLDPCLLQVGDKIVKLEDPIRSSFDHPPFKAEILIQSPEVRLVRNQYEPIV